MSRPGILARLVLQQRTEVENFVHCQFSSRHGHQRIDTKGSFDKKTQKIGRILITMFID